MSADFVEGKTANCWNGCPTPMVKADQFPSLPYQRVLGSRLNGEVAVIFLVSDKMRRRVNSGSNGIDYGAACG